MKKSLLLLVWSLIAAPLTFAQTLTLLDTVQFSFVTNQLGDVGSSDCWGWIGPDGTDYAIIGNYDNVAFVRASDGAVLDVEVAADQQDGYYHRDMVTYRNYCYVVAEMTGTREGLMVFDLSPLPDSVRFVGTYTAMGNLVRSHNLDVDTATGYLYLESDEFQGPSGVEIIDISDPENPNLVNFISVPATHDIHARNDTLWVAEGSARAFSVYDVSDKQNPVLLGRVASPSFGYCHNIWPSDDGKFFVTTEETPNRTVKIWDATDMSNIVQRGTYLGANNLAHNVHIQGNLIFISHYTAGVTVVDFSDPDQPVEIAAYDTYPQNNFGNFFGCWGTFPYTNNNYVYASNFEGTLFILEWDATAINVDEAAPRGPGLTYPNPFTEVTNIPFGLDATTPVNISVYDLQGQHVATLMDRELDAGSYVLPWRPRMELSGGLYIIRLDAGSASGVRKVELLR
ncbi:MAG: choice-of-anchor B family protein [Bacteroidota bacterium]